MPDKLDRRVRNAIATRPGTDVDTFVVTFRDPVTGTRSQVHSIMGAPGAKPDTSAGVPAGIASALTSARAPYYQGLTDTLQTRFGASVIRSFWLAHAMTVRMPIGRLDTLALWPAVLKVDPQWAEEAPQWGKCGDGSHKMFVARDRIRAGNYSALAFGRISLFDTGLDSGHSFLRDDSGWRCWEHLLMCPVTCGSSATQVDQNGEGHGTCSAVILAGRGAASDADRGLTTAQLASYQVYGRPHPDSSARVNVDWATAAFQDAFLKNATLIVAEMAIGCGGFGPLTAQANLAFDRGIAVIAANGNRQGWGVCTPANAARALGVGAYCIDSPNKFVTEHAHGWLSDGRIKPEVIAPTGVSVGALPSGTFRNFPGTSGATPFVGAAALMLKNWMAQSGQTVLPGHLYALLTLCGQNGSVSTQNGAGSLVLPTTGRVYCGVRTVSEEDWETVEIDTGAQPVSGLEAAIWWPEYGTSWGGFPAVGERAWIGVSLVPEGATLGPTSDAFGSVFQRISASGTQRKWSVQFQGLYVPDGSRQVYYAVWAKP